MIQRDPETGKIKLSYNSSDAEMFAAAKVAHDYTRNGKNPMSNPLFGISA